MLRTFNNYYLTTHIVRRVMWDVYLAHPINKAELNVVLKIFDDDCLKQGVTSDAVAHTAAILTNLQHPHIASPIEIGLEHQQLFVASPYIAGDTLQQHLDQHATKNFALTDALHLVIQIGTALVAAHQQKILHKQLRPEHILFNREEEAFLTDFSLDDLINKLLYEDLPDVHTIAYLAPEQLANEGVSAKSDQYALGCLLYELVTGKLPFSNNELYLIWQRGIQSQPVPPSQIVTHLPKPLEEAILQALSLEPAQRYPDVATFIAILQSQLQSEPPAFPFELSGDDSAAQAIRAQKKNPGKKKKKTAPRARIGSTATDPGGDMLPVSVSASATQKTRNFPPQRRKPSPGTPIIALASTDPDSMPANLRQQGKQTQNPQLSVDNLTPEPDLFEWLGDDDNEVSSPGEAEWIEESDLSSQNSTDIPVVMHDHGSSKTAASERRSTELPIDAEASNSAMWWERAIDESEEKVALAHVPPSSTTEEENDPYTLEEGVDGFTPEEVGDDASPVVPEPTFPFSHLLKTDQRKKPARKKEEHVAKATPMQTGKPGAGTSSSKKVETHSPVFTPVEAESFSQNINPFATTKSSSPYPQQLNQNSSTSSDNLDVQDTFPSYPDLHGQDSTSSYPDATAQNALLSSPDKHEHNSMRTTSTPINSTPGNTNRQMVPAGKIPATYPQQTMTFSAEFRKTSNRLLAASLIIAVIGLLFSFVFSPIFTEIAHVTNNHKPTASTAPTKPTISATPTHFVTTATATSVPTATPQPTPTAQVTATPKPTQTPASTPISTTQSTTAAPPAVVPVFTYFSASGGGSYNTSVNMTNDGSIDWVHWGYPTGTDVTTKNVQTHVIGSATWNGKTSGDTSQSNNYSWSDSTSNSVNDITSGTDIAGGNVTFPVTTDGAAHTLKVYAGAYLAQGTLTVSLNGKTAYSKSFNMTHDAANKGDNTEFIVSYNTNVASQMTITYAMTKSDGSSSYIILEAASVS